MPKGKPNKQYTEEFKQHVVEAMQKEHLSYSEAARHACEMTFFLT